LKLLVFKRIWFTSVDANGILFLFWPGARDALSARNHAGGCHLGAGYFLDLTGRTRPIVHLHALTEPQLAGTWFTGQRLRRHRWQLRKCAEAGQNTECLQQSARAEYFDCGWGSAIDCHRSFSTVDTFSPNLCSASLLPTKSIEAAAILKAIHVSSTQRRPSQGHNAAMMASNPSVSAAGPGCKISGDLISTTRS
jgi:hypothetical protein